MKLSAKRIFLCFLAGILSVSAFYGCQPSNVGQSVSEDSDSVSSSESQPDEDSSSSAKTDEDSFYESSSSTHSHIFGEWQIITSATCQKTGEKIRSCACGVTEKENIDKVDHEYNAAHICRFCGALDPAFAQPAATYLVKDGISDYIILYESGDEAIKRAAKQLQAYFEEATGVKLRILEYSGAHIPTGRYFFLGAKPAKAAALSFEDLHNDTAYAVQTKGKAVYIYGNTGSGVQNGITAYLNELFNYTVYYEDLYELVHRDTVPFTEMSKTGGPVFTYTFSGYGELIHTPEYESAMGFITNYYVSGGGIHNATELISRAKYGNTHPEWFYTGTTADGYNTGDQLYLAAENFAVGEGTLVTTVADNLYTTIKNNPKLSIFGFSPMDVDIWPTGAGYENSDALLETYGTNVAEYILFMNAVARELEKKGLDRKIQLELLAYNKTLCAPVITDLSEEEIQKIKLYDGEAVRIVPYVAPVEANYHLALDDARNIVKNPQTGRFDKDLTVARVIQDWGKLTDEIHFWWYSLDCDSYFMPLDTITNMQKVYQFAYENKVTVIFNQSQFDTPVSTDWARLKIYLQSEFAKNPYADTETLVDGFMNAYFGVAAPQMKQLLQAEKIWYQTLFDTSLMGLGYYWLGTLRGSAWCTQDIYNASQWTMTMSGNSDDTLLSWMGYIEGAKQVVERAPSLSAEEKETLLDRIDLESLPARWVLAKVFGTTRYDKDLNAFYAFAKSLGMTKKGEGQAI